MHTYRIQRTLSLVAVLVFALLLAGCGEREPPEPPPPPPPTPEEIAAKIMTELQLNQPLPAPGSTFPTAAGRNFLSTVRGAKTQHSVSPDGVLALQIVSQRLDSRLRALEDNELWEHVLAYSDAHLILNPGSRRFNRTRDKAVVELRKPRVTIEGFFYDGKNDQTSVFMNFYLPMEKVTYREKVRVGEEFYGLKMVEIIGRSQGVTMEYMETDETFDVLFESANR